MLLSYLTSGKRIQYALVATAALFAMSCDNAVSSGNQIHAIVITPSSLALTTGATRVVSATVLDEIGASLPNNGVHWSVQNPLVATVTAEGIVTAVAAGKTQVAASKGGKSGVAAIVVSTLPPALVRVTPTASTVLVGNTATFTAEVRDVGGGILTGYPVTWTSSTPTVATVSANGVVTGVANGNSVIGAMAAGLNGTAVVTVRPAPVATVAVTPTSGTVVVGQSLQINVTLLDAVGRVLTGRTVTWSSSDQNAATVSAAGLVRGRAKGTAIITTTSEGKTAKATITVP